jgi:hypothetical protein
MPTNIVTNGTWQESRYLESVLALNEVIQSLGIKLKATWEYVHDEDYNGTYVKVETGAIQLRFYCTSGDLKRGYISVRVANKVRIDIAEKYGLDAREFDGDFGLGTLYVSKEVLLKIISVETTEVLVKLMDGGTPPQCIDIG